MTELGIDDAGQPLCLSRVTLKATKAREIICSRFLSHVQWSALHAGQNTLTSGASPTSAGRCRPDKPASGRGEERRHKKGKKTGKCSLPRGDICPEQHSSLTPYVSLQKQTVGHQQLAARWHQSQTSCVNVTF